jgi:DNA repair exonuclease SbcCD ATPase subunit
MAKEQEVVFDFDKVVFGGYDVEQVEEYAAEMEQTVASLKKENVVLTQKLRFLAAKIEEYRAQEAEMKKMLAQKEASASAPSSAELAQGAKGEELHKANAALQQEVDQLKQTVVELRKANEALQTEKENIEKPSQADGREEQQLRKVLETARAAFVAQTERAEKAERLLAKLRQEEQAFFHELVEKSKARMDLLISDAFVPAEAPAAAIPEVPVRPEPVAAAVSEAPVQPEPVAAAASEDSKVSETVKSVLEAVPEPEKEAPSIQFEEQIRRMASKEIAKQNSAEKAPKKEETSSFTDQSYEECLARILQQEAQDANLKPGESKLVSLRAPEGQRTPERAPEGKRTSSRSRDADWRSVMQPEPAKRQENKPAPPVKKKKQGLMDLIKEGIQRALSDEDDEEDLEEEPGTLQFGKAYDFRKRK